MDGNVELVYTMENSMKVPQKLKINLLYDPTNTSWMIYVRKELKTGYGEYIHLMFVHPFAYRNFEGIWRLFIIMELTVGALGRNYPRNN